MDDDRVPLLPRNGTSRLQHRRLGLTRQSLGLCALAVLLALSAACRAPLPDEGALRARIAAMQTALAEGRANDFMDALADDFIGPEADFDRRRAAWLLRFHLQRHRAIRVDLGPPELDLRGERAEVRFIAVLRAGEGLLPEEFGAWRVVTGWRREGREWKLISARWERALGG
jgi:hypothetical protein